MSSPPNIAEIMFGEQTFSGSTAKVTVQALILQDLKDGRHTSKMFPSKVLKKHGHGSAEMASIDHDGRHGQWYRHALIAEDGVILFFTGSAYVSRRPMYDAGAIIRLRQSGPFQRVRFVLPTEPSATFQSLPMFTGRGDLLTPKELEELGYAINRGQIDTFFDEEELEEALIVEELGAAIEDKPTLMTVRQNDGSESVLEVPSAPKRRLRRRAL
jgi:hypothetical protein